MSTQTKQRGTFFVTGLLMTSIGVLSYACGSSDNGNDTTIVIPKPDGGGTTGGAGGTDMTGGTGGATGGAGGSATGGAGGTDGDGSAGTGGGGTGGTGGGGTGGTGGAGGTGGTGGTSDGGPVMCQSSGSYDNSMLPLLPDGGLPPL